jgi:hypothetical protein
VLLRRESLGAADVVRRVVALQAQHVASPYLALWNRLTDFDPADLDAAFAYRRSHAFHTAVAALGAKRKFIKPTARGRTARSSGSTGPSRSSGPTVTSSSATTSVPKPLPHGSRSTTLNVATQHSAVSHPSAACDHRDGRIHLEAEEVLDPGPGLCFRHVQEVFLPELRGIEDVGA